MEKQLFLKHATTISNTNLLSLHFVFEHQDEFTSWLAGESQVCVLPLQFLLISLISFNFQPEKGRHAACLLVATENLSLLTFSFHVFMYSQTCDNPYCDNP